MALRIQRELLNQIRQHGEQSYPHECCGVLVGFFGAADRTVQRVVNCANASSESPRTHYEISPTDLLRVQREANLADQQIVGFYHSHPDHPARWSPTDLDEAHWPGCSYLITAVEKGKATATNSFLLVSEGQTRRFEDELIEVDDPPGN